MTRELSKQKETRIVEGHLMPDHVHVRIENPPKFAVAKVIEYIKSKSAIYIARRYADRKRNFVGQHFSARGYFASSVGKGEEKVREYIQHQELDDERIDQLSIL